MKPIKAQIHLLEIVTTGNLDDREIHFINFFRKLNPLLTNMTDGGKGKSTSKYYTEEELENYSKKLSLSLKGKKKPIGFSENLSKNRKGILNPGAKELKDWIVSVNNGKPEKLFKYGFEINNFLRNKHAYGNIVKTLRNSPHHTPYKRAWILFKDCNKNIQDIVRIDYESNHSAR